jgi:hypothetical protein
MIVARCDRAGLYRRKSLHPQGSRHRRGVTSTVAARINTGRVMESFDFDYTVAVILAVLVSLGRIVSVLFATLKLCVREYHEFRLWWLALRRESKEPQ